MRVTSSLQAFWIDRATIAVPNHQIQSGWTLSLQIGSLSSIVLTKLNTGLTSAQTQRYPQLAQYSVYQIPTSVSVATLKQALKSQLAVKATDAGGTLQYVTGLQIAGILDDLFYYSGPLGATFQRGKISINVWAPTAQSVKLQLFHTATDKTPASISPMTENNGVWNIQIDPSWTNKYYLLAVTVYVPSLQQIVENVVTDPYSADLALNGLKTRLTNLSSESAKPQGWDQSESPQLESKNDLTIYELHLRDFSATDSSVPPQYRGTYLAFTDPATNGMRHLHQLAASGLKALHLLPTFHIASINEDKSTWQSHADLSAYPPDSVTQQAAVAAIQNFDPYNWGYDPVHYMAPEGSYAFHPDNRVKEYREMVQSIHRAGLRVFQDVVFNHTAASGQATDSVLDKLVPTYYHRLDADGKVENLTCCSDTASEHRMMEKLMIDTLVMNARYYKIDGFRFDLMGYHFADNLRHIQHALAQLTLEKDGVDGAKIYLYGEGWAAASTANNPLRPNATQANLYGTGIGSFNDRIRDAIRGGGPFSDQRIQGFATGLYTDSSQYTAQNTPNQVPALLQISDWIRAGLAGNLRDFSFMDSAGQTVTAGSLIYSGQPVGYTATAAENIVYASVHDNQTLFDAIQLKCNLTNTVAQRTRRQILANSLIALAQGIPFFPAGDDLLRSKDMDNNSYNSGDWFNAIDFTFQTNNWGVGLPLAKDNQSNWPIMQPLLANSALKPSPANIDLARRVFQEFLLIRAGSKLFRLSTLAQVQSQLHFINTGPNQIPGVIVMTLGQHPELLVVFNATTSTVNFQHASLKGLKLQLHPIQGNSADTTVRQSSFNSITGTAAVPALTTAVFIANGGR